jgi:pimeloyl-ACP methyl ester carboxylesterase
MSHPAPRIVDTALPFHVEEYADQSEGDEHHAFLLVHGFGGSTFTWRYWAPRLAQRSRTLVVDLMGFGSAPKPTNATYEPGEQAQMLEDLLIEQGVRSVTLIGHSMGGGICLLTGLRLRDTGSVELRALVLVAAAAHRQRLPPLVGFSRRPGLTKRLVRAIGPKRIVRATLRSIVYDSASITPEDSHTARYPEIAVPTLLLWGDTDRVIPMWVAQRLEAELPHATLCVLPRCGHVPPEEQPRESWSAVNDFLRDVFDVGP